MAIGSLYMETTKKNPEQTIAEIQSVLKKLAVRNWLMDYGDDGEVDAVSFTLRNSEGVLFYRLPVNHNPLWQMAQQGKTKYIRDEIQARRVAWRQTLRWVEAQCALIAVGMASAEEVFFPYMLLDDKQTVYEKFKSEGLNNYYLNGRE